MNFSHILSSRHFLFLVLCILGVYATPQQNINDIVKISSCISYVFPMNPSPTPTQPRRTGFNLIVTPEPVDPSKPQPTFTSISGRAQCNCVPYHMCDPSTNSVTQDEEFDGFGLIDIRFNSDDPVCEHFLDVCCDNNRTLTNSLNPTPVVNRPDRPKGCGIRNVGGVDFNITGAFDNEAGFGEFPWTVALLTDPERTYFCTGSLIHPRVVLTAVHCVIERKTSAFIVRAGEWDTQTTRERLPFQERIVKNVITHPQYNPRNVAYDFALVILSEPFTLDDHINVVCLPAQDASPATHTSCYSLPIVEFNDCQNKFRSTRLGPKFALNRSFICAGGIRGVDTCQGDGGAPLSCPIGIATDNRFQQSGIVAWGIGCNDEIPAAYANVAIARNWIDEQMLANGLGTSTYSAL